VKCDPIICGVLRKLLYFISRKTLRVARQSRLQSQGEKSVTVRPADPCDKTSHTFFSNMPINSHSDKRYILMCGGKRL